MLCAKGLLDSISPVIMIVIYCLLGVTVLCFAAYLTYYLLRKKKGLLCEDYPAEANEEHVKEVQKVDGENCNDEGIPYDDILDEEGDYSVTYFVSKQTNVLPRCFLSKLKLSNEKLIKTYSAIKNELMSFDGVTSTYRIGCEVFYRNGICARIKLKNGIIHLYLKTHISQLEISRYDCHKVIDDPSVVDTDIEMLVINKKTIRYAKTLIYDMFAVIDVYKFRGFKPVDYSSIFEKKGNTIMAEKNIKILEDYYG